MKKVKAIQTRRSKTWDLSGSVLTILILTGCSNVEGSRRVREVVEIDMFSNEDGAVRAAQRSSPRSRVQASTSTVDDQTSLSTPVTTSVDVEGEKPIASAATAPSAGAGANTSGGAGTATSGPVMMEGTGRWLVDGFVGQVNGRPIFADELLLDIRDRLIQAVRMQDRRAGRQAFAKIVDDQFERWVTNALVVSEAESLLSPEEQQGLLAFMRDFQDQRIAERGGTRAAAEQSIWEEENISLEQFIERSRNELLAGDIIRRRVRPRVIVSWKDIEREYARRYEEFNPPGLASVSRISLNSDRDTEKIADVQRRLASGESFGEIASGLGLPGGGAWVEVALGEEGLAAADLRREYKEVMEGLEPGRVSDPFVVGATTNWLMVTKIDRPPGRSVFDAEVQQILRRDLTARRTDAEVQRYIASLKRRWVTEDLNIMKTRVMEIAFLRYWQ